MRDWKQSAFPLSELTHPEGFEPPGPGSKASNRQSLVARPVDTAAPKAGFTYNPRRAWLLEAEDGFRRLEHQLVEHRRFCTLWWRKRRYPGRAFPGKDFVGLYAPTGVKDRIFYLTMAIHRSLFGRHYSVNGSSE